MNKEELLKYLIIEIDLIMHDKDYRFENEDGSWYSRESCRNLTNEEVFEELKTELRQLADLEAKLAESENKVKEYATEITRRNTEQLDMQTRSFLKIRDLDTEILELKQQLADTEAQNKRVLEKLDLITRSNQELEKELAKKEHSIGMLNQHLTDKAIEIEGLGEELAEKEKELQELRFKERNIFPFVENLEDKINQDKISFCIDKLEQVQKYIITDEKDMFGMIYLMKPSYIYDYIDNQIAELKKGVE